MVRRTSALTGGTARIYSEDYMERISELKNGQTSISELDTVPDFLTRFDISKNPEYWVNQDMAAYYGLEEITAKPVD